MATRAMIPEQARGDPVHGGAKQKPGAEGIKAKAGTRRALHDIGNMVTIRGVDGKPLPHVSRPITRSFCAQLLANAQAAAENKKAQPACLNADGIMVDKQVKGTKVGRAPVAVAKPVQKKVSVKPQPEEVIDLSPDTVEDVKKEKPLTKKKPGEGAKKKAATLTSVLTARSKAACGLTDEPKARIEDIDAGDAENELAVVEYVEDMYKFYKEAECGNQVGDYMLSQPEINEKMRGILIDWLIEVHNKFELMKETLYLTINIVDRFLAVTKVPRRELQLVGIGAMLTASKYEEIWAPEVNDYVCISDKAYTNQQILMMEKTILGKLEWTLTVPTPYVFLVRFIKAAFSDEEMENMVHFFAELGMVHYATIQYCPSMIAASAVYAARCTLNKSPAWNDTLTAHTGFSEQQLRGCAKLMVGYHSMASDHKLKVVYRKYSNPERKAVALMPPAKFLLATTSSSY